MQHLLAHIRPALAREDNRQWEWDWKSYYLQPERLSTELHDRFNSHTLPINRPEDFRREVEACAELAATEEEFMKRLEERKNQHLQEMMRAWRSICAVVESNSWLLAISDSDNEQHADKENIHKETLDKRNTDKGRDDDGNKSEPNHDEGDGNREVDGDDGGLDDGTASTAADLSVAPQHGSMASLDSPTFYLDDITETFTEGKRRWASKTCAELLQKRRMQRLATSTASDCTTAETLVPGSLFCAGIWNPDGLLPSSSLPERPLTSQESLPPVKATPVADSPSDKHQEQSQIRHPQVTSEHSHEVIDAGLTAPPGLETPGGEGYGLTNLTEPPLAKPEIHNVVREAASSTSTQEPMEIYISEEDEDVIMTDAVLSEESTFRKARTRTYGSRRQAKHRDGDQSHGKRSMAAQQQQNRVNKKQGRRRSSQGKTSSLLLDRLLRSTRSSRRDSGHDLWYLGDDATACPVTNAE